MSWIKRAVKWVVGRPADPVEWGWLGGLPASSGERVDHETALEDGGVNSCLRIISETVASLPLKLYRKKGDGTRQEVDSHRAISILREPAPYLTQFEFFEAISGIFALSGAVFVQKIYSPGDEIDQLAILTPGTVTPFWYTGEGETARMVTVPTPGMKVAFSVQPSGGARYTLLSDEVLWFRLRTTSGLDWVDPITSGKESIGTSLATRKYAGKYFANGVSSGTIFTIPPGIPTDKYKAMRESLTAAFASGSDSFHKMRLMPQGVDAKRLGDDADKAQLTEISSFNLLDVGRIWRMQPNKLQDYSRATWNNTEQMNIAFSQDVVLPMSLRIEQALDHSLLTPAERARGMYFKFNLAGLLRGDLDSRYRAYSVGRQWGWLSANDVRALEDMDPVEGGDVYLTPSNMLDANAPAPAPAAPAPEPETKPAEEPAEAPEEPEAPEVDARVFAADAAARICGAAKDTPPEKLTKYVEKTCAPFRADAAAVQAAMPLGEAAVTEAILGVKP